MACLLAFKASQQKLGQVAKARQYQLSDPTLAAISRSYNFTAYPRWQSITLEVDSRANHLPEIHQKIHQFIGNLN